MQEQLQSPEKESEAKVLEEVFREAAGIEKGLIRTFLDLRSKPKEVLEGYKAGDRKYVGPFRLLLASLSLWILINGFLIDWYALWKGMMSGILEAEVSLIAWLKGYDEVARQEAMRKLEVTAGPFLDIYCRFAGDLFSKWYVPYALVGIVLGSLHFTRRQREKNISLRDTLYILSYSVGANIPFLLFISLIFWLNLWAALAACAIILVLNLSGNAHLISFAPVRTFFPQETGKAIEKKLMGSVFLVVMVGLALLIGLYMGYYTLF